MYYHKNHSKVFKRWYIALVIIIFIIGIIAGFVFKVEPAYSLYSSKPKFNWLLTIIIWLSDVIPAAVLYAVYSHLENQEIQINILNALRESTVSEVSKDETTDYSGNYRSTTPAAKTSSDNVSPMRKLDEENNYWKCPKCGINNPFSMTHCRECKTKNI